MQNLPVALEYEYMHSIYTDFYSLPLSQGIVKSIKITYNHIGMSRPQIFYRWNDSMEFQKAPDDTYVCNIKKKEVFFNIYKLYQNSGNYKWKIVIEDYVYEDKWNNHYAALNINSIQDDLSVLNDAIFPSLAEASYFKNYVYVSIPNVADPGLSQDDLGNLVLASTPAFKNIKIINIHEGESQEINVPISYGVRSTQKIEIPAGWRDTSIKISIEDVADRVYEFEPSNKTFFRADSLTKTSENLQFATFIKPYSNSSNIQSNIPILGVPYGSKDVEIKYIFSANNKNQEYIISYDQNVDKQGSTYTFSSNIINNLLINLFSNDNSSINDQYSTNLRMAISSGFETLDFNCSFLTDFIENPYIQNGRGLTLAYLTANGYSSITSNDGVEPRMYNYNEIIRFTTPTFQDSNQDIQSCIIEAAKVGLTDDINADIAKLSNASYFTLAEYNYNTENIYNYTLPFYPKNEILCFRARVRDSKGNYSEYSDVSTYVIACRTTDPKFNINNLNLSSSGSGTQIDFDLEITDLGGSAKSSWTQNFYNLYKNFERTVQDKDKKMILEVRVRNNYWQEKIETFEQARGNMYTSFSGRKSRKIDIEKTEIMYVTFTLRIYYGQSIQLVEASSQYTIGKIPTVSFKPHQIGINTNQLEHSSILTIEKYKDYQYIVLKLDNDRILNIDLNTGEIRGAILNGGSW